MRHSLEAAMLDGTISDSAMQAGLSALDLERLGESYGEAQILVRLCSVHKQTRAMISVEMSVGEMLAWRAAPTPRMVRGTWWYVEHFKSAWPIKNTL